MQLLCLVILLAIYATSLIFASKRTVSIFLLLLQGIWQIILISLLLSDWQLSKEYTILLLLSMVVLIPLFYYYHCDLVRREVVSKNTLHIISGSRVKIVVSLLLLLLITGSVVYFVRSSSQSIANQISKLRNDVDISSQQKRGDELQKGLSGLYQKVSTNYQSGEGKLVTGNVFEADFIEITIEPKSINLLRQTSLWFLLYLGVVLFSNLYVFKFTQNEAEEDDVHNT